MTDLALFGGEKTVTFPHPHFIWPERYESEIEAVVRYMRTGKVGKYGYPEIVEEFENRFKEYHGMNYALALNSGTSCLHAGYYALGIKPGDEVIVPNFTFPATALPLFALGATPILCDCLTDTATIDPADIARKITSNTKAIAITHLWGHPCEMDEIMALSRKHNIPVLEDCSHAHGAKYKGQLVGTFGEIGIFSFDNQKLPGSGEAGILVTNSKRYFEKCIILSDFGGRVKLQLELEEFAKFKETGLALKYRIHPIAAAIANEKMKILDQLNQGRVSTLNYFSERLRETKSIIPPVTKDYVERGGFFGYKPIYNGDALNGLSIDDFIKVVWAEGVDIRQTVSPPLHRTELFRDSKNYGMALNAEYRGKEIVYQPDDFPHSEWFQANHLSFATFSKESDRAIIDQYLIAIHKVEEAITGNPGIVREIRTK